MAEPEARVTERFELVGVTHERPRQRMAIRLGAFALAALASMMVGAIVGPFGFMIAALAAYFAFRGAIAKHDGTRTAMSTEALLRDGVLRIHSINLAVRREDVRQGLESNGDDGVVLDLTDGEVLRLAFVPGSGAAKRVLAAMGAGVEQRTAQVPLRRVIGRFTIGFLTFCLGLYPSTLMAEKLVTLFYGEIRPLVAFPLLVGLAAAMAWGMMHRFGSPHVVIGADGIRVRGLLTQPFYRYSEITGVRSEGWQVILELRGGKVRTLPVVAVDLMRVNGLVKRIEQARRHATDGRTFLADSLARAGRTMPEWRASLEHLAKREASFREAPLDRDEVARVATDPEVDAEQRVAAAFVLTRIDVEGGRQQIRIAANATVDEELKSALLAAAEGEMESPAIGRVMKRG